MSFNWINTSEFTIDSLLLMDRCLIKMIIMDYGDWEEYYYHLGIALAYKQYVAWYCINRAPECKGRVEGLLKEAPDTITEDMVRVAEDFVLDVLDWAIVYVHPEIMNSNCNYIYNWDKSRLLEMVDFDNKIVLDVGSGTGRLAFAAAEKAKHVYASEPVDRLREFMRDKIKTEEIQNITVVDGTIENIPYEDNTFDIVMCGHVLGDNYDKELAELTRVLKNEGYIIDCMGDDDRRREKPAEELLKRGFEYFYYRSSLGGDIFRYRKRISK